MYHSHRLEIDKIRTAAGRPKKDEVVKENVKKWFHTDAYTYNADADTYITFLRSAPKPITMQGDVHRAMQRAYSNWDGNPGTINEICRQFSFPRAWFVEYKSVHGWTHDKEPFTNEEIMSRKTEDMVKDALEQRRSVLFQKYEQEKWKQTKDDADKWKALVHGEITPFNLAVEQWKPVKPFALPKVKDDELHSFIVSATDWQVGLKAIEEDMDLGKNWDLTTARKVLENYLSQIYRDVQRFRLNWDKCYLFNLGDIPHGFYGKTERGTPLIMDATRRQQFDAVISLQTFFIEGLYEIFGKLEEVGVGGNHEGAFGWYAVSRTLQERYRNAGPNLIISATMKTVVHKRVGDVLFILTHGKNGKGYKSEFSPNDGDKRQAQIQQEILYVLQEIQKEDGDALKGIVQTVFVQGDKHFYRQIEQGTYEDLQFGSPSMGDLYADTLRLKSRPSQNCILVSHTYGIRAPLRYYFDVDVKL
jgi:hypothetical protein